MNTREALTVILPIGPWERAKKRLKELSWGSRLRDKTVKIWSVRNQTRHHLAALVFELLPKIVLACSYTELYCYTRLAGPGHRPNKAGRRAATRFVSGCRGPCRDHAAPPGGR